MLNDTTQNSYKILYKPNVQITTIPWPLFVLWGLGLYSPGLQSCYWGQLRFHTLQTWLREGELIGQLRASILFLWQLYIRPSEPADPSQQHQSHPVEKESFKTLFMHSCRINFHIHNIFTTHSWQMYDTFMCSKICMIHTDFFMIKRNTCACIW